MAGEDDLELEELRRWLDDVEEKESVLRLVTAIGHENGLDVETLAAWYGLTEERVQTWLHELEAQPLAELLDEVERYNRERAPPFIPRIRSRVRYLDYEALDDHGWSVHDDDLFEKARAADLDASDFGGFVVEPGETILEAAEGRGFEWPFACRGGACANCAVILVRGEIAMPGDHILPTTAVEEDGVRLTCVGVPVTDEIDLVFNAKHEPTLDELRLPPGPFLSGARGR